MRCHSTAQLRDLGLLRQRLLDPVLTHGGDASLGRGTNRLHGVSLGDGDDGHLMTPTPVCLPLRDPGPNLRQSLRQGRIGHGG